MTRPLAKPNLTRWAQQTAALVDQIDKLQDQLKAAHAEGCRHWPADVCHHALGQALVHYGLGIEIAHPKRPDVGEVIFDSERDLDLSGGDPN
mgnify:CR=1 FL=1